MDGADALRSVFAQSVLFVLLSKMGSCAAAAPRRCVAAATSTGVYYLLIKDSSPSFDY